MIAFVERQVSLAYSAVGMTIDFNSLILILTFSEVELQIGWKRQRTPAAFPTLTSTSHMESASCLYRNGPDRGGLKKLQCSAKISSHTNT